MTLAEKLAQIESLACRHNHPGVNVGAHRLAQQVLAIIRSSPTVTEPDIEDLAANLSAEGT